VMLDPKGTSMDVELRSSRLQVAPRAGAVVPLKFETSSGRAVLIQGRQAHGETLPFGAQVLDAQGLEIGVVGQGGRVFARGGEQGDTLTVRWGESATQQCRLDYRLPARASNDRNSGFSTTEAECR
jgi:outer membrane usher protein